jgi:hypothetical protein
MKRYLPILIASLFSTGCETVKDLKIVGAFWENPYGTERHDVIALEPVIGPNGEKQLLAEPPEGKMKVIPAPARPQASDWTQTLKDENKADIWLLETPWYKQGLWLYPDGSYAQEDPQRIMGSWNRVGDILRLQPNHGGLQLFGHGPHETWISKSGEMTQLVPLKVSPAK